jgi:hypothetical protein
MVQACRVAGLMICLAISPWAQGAEGDPAVGVVTRRVPDNADWLVRSALADKAVYRGAVSFDDAGIGGFNALYPAPNLIGFFAAVVVHGLIADSAQESKKAKIREEADKVLLPYQPTLETITQGLLLTQALAKTSGGASKKLVDLAAPAEAGWIIETVPVFSMTQDERALVLDNAVIVRAPEAPEGVVYQNVVRVVSHPRPMADEKLTALGYWSGDDGRMLRQESVSLLAESMSLVFAELAKGPDASEVTHKTVRYPEGGGERIERAGLVAERCDRLVFKTLRGWLVSVPRMGEAGAACDSATLSVGQAASSPAQ